MYLIKEQCLGLEEKQSVSSVCWSWKNLNPWIKIFFPELLADPCSGKNLNPPVEIFPSPTNSRERLI